MKPSKFCKCIQCSDYPHYTECADYEYENLIAEGKISKIAIRQELNKYDKK